MVSDSFNLGQQYSSDTVSITPARAEQVLDLATHEIIRNWVHERGSALNQSIQDSPSWGSTRSLGGLKISLKYGEFTAYAFESTVNGKHIIALTKGEIQSSDPLLIRMHSECITSETLGGCDCDCVEQLNTALERIGEEGRGILFYLRQEGRGAGYSSKGRDRMAVCASENRIQTFEAYHHLGLPSDKRTYESLSEIAYLLDIQAPLEVMTNNPDKISALEAQGFEIAQQRQLFVPPNPYNAFYLVTKSQNGHLFDPGTVKDIEYPWPVNVFRPYHLEGALRFVHNASYPLPIKPVSGVLILNAAEIEELQEILQSLKIHAIEELTSLNHGKFRVALNEDSIAEVSLLNPQNDLTVFIARHSYWFNDHIYHDTLKGWDYVALVYEANDRVEPLVRIHSENLLQRFPLSPGASDTYERSIQAIVEHGRGMLLLYPEDGKGKGFSAAFMEKRLVQLGLASDPATAAQKLGLNEDERTYDGIALLIKHHYPQEPIRLIHGSAESMVKKVGLSESLARLGLETLEPILIKK